MATKAHLAYERVRRAVRSLQYQFIESKGSPLTIGGRRVTQRDTVPIEAGVVTVRFISTRRGAPTQGVQLDAGKKGKIIMSDGTATERLDIWRFPNLPDTVRHEVSCPSGILSVSNRYEVRCADGSTVPEHWTGNAGMVLLQTETKRRRYGCSDGIGDFDPGDLVFELEWSGQAV